MPTFAGFRVFENHVTVLVQFWTFQVSHRWCLSSCAQKPLKVKDLEKLRSYVKPAVPVPKVGTKQKVVVDLMPESTEAERLGVASCCIT